jgi:hypothetical protein
VLSDADIKHEQLSRFRAVIYYDEFRVSEPEAEALEQYVQNGGVVIAMGAMAAYDELYRQRAFVSGSAWPPGGIAIDADQEEAHQIGAGWLITAPRPAGENPHTWPGAAGLDDITSYLQQYVGPTLPTLPLLAAPQATRMRVAAWSGYRRQVVHLVNYDVPFGWKPCSGGSESPAMLTNVKVRLSAPGWTPTAVRIHSWETGVSTGVVPVTYDQVTETVSFVIPAMHIYSIAELY